MRERERETYINAQKMTLDPGPWLLTVARPMPMRKAKANADKEEGGGIEATGPTWTGPARLQMNSLYLVDVVNANQF